MNKLLSFILIGSALTLSACGGDSDSSGSYNTSEDPVQFQGLPNCQINGTTINVDELGRGCLVKRSNINNGKKFSLSCQIAGTPPRSITNFNIISSEGGNPDEVKRDIGSANGKYVYNCRK